MLLFNVMVFWYSLQSNSWICHIVLDGSTSCMSIIINFSVYWSREFNLPRQYDEVQLHVLNHFPNVFIISPAFRYQKKVSNIIDDVLEWSPKLAISGMIEKHTGANMTEASNYTSMAGSSHAPPSAEGNATEAVPDMDADGDTRADSDEIQDSDYADDTRARSTEA